MEIYIYIDREITTVRSRKGGGRREEGSDRTVPSPPWENCVASMRKRGWGGEEPRNSLYDELVPKTMEGRRHYPNDVSVASSANIKGRTVSGGNKQRTYIPNKYYSSPTVSK